MIFGLLKNDMINKKKNDIFIFFILILYISCENNMKNIQSLVNKNPSKEEAKDITIYFSSAGKPKSIIKSPFMIRNNENNIQKTEFLNKVNIDFYKDSVNIESRLSAKYGYFIENDNTVYFKDSVICYNLLGDTLWTNELSWDSKTERFFSNQPIKLKKSFPKSTIYSLSFESNRNLTKYIFNNVQKNSFLILHDSLNSQ